MRPSTRTKCKEYCIMKKITRRQFLTSAGATSAALLLSSLPHAAAADENCLRKVTPAATNSNDLSWDMAEEILTHISDPVFPAYTVNVLDYGASPTTVNWTPQPSSAPSTRPAPTAAARSSSLPVCMTSVPSPSRATSTCIWKARTPSCASPGTSPRPTTRWCSPTTKLQAVQLEPADLRLSAGEHRSDRQGHPRRSG